MRCSSMTIHGARRFPSLPNCFDFFLRSREFGTYLRLVVDLEGELAGKTSNEHHEYPKDRRERAIQRIEVFDVAISEGRHRCKERQHSSRRGGGDRFWLAKRDARLLDIQLQRRNLQRVRRREERAREEERGPMRDGQHVLFLA